MEERQFLIRQERGGHLCIFQPVFYNIIYGPFLIIIGILSLKNQELLPWVVWNLSHVLLVLSLFVYYWLDSLIRENLCLSCIRSLNIFVYFVNSLYVVIYMMGLPLSILAISNYSIRKLSYACSSTIIITSLESLYIIYLYMIGSYGEDDTSTQRDFNITDVVYDIESRDSNCVICIDDYTDGEVLAKLDCDHIFHKKCIVPWLKNNSSCPICRIDV